MTYGEIKRAVLELIDQYSAAGTELADTYNNQADALARIPGLINQALSEIRGVVPERAIHHVDLTEQSGHGWISVRLPDDCRRVISGTLPPGSRLAGEREVLVQPGEYFIGYERYPERLPVSPPPADGYDLREKPDVLDCAVCQAAARLVMREDEFTYAALSNEYETRLARLIPPPSAEYIPIAEV